MIIIHFFSFATKGTSQRKWTEADLPHHNCKVQVAADWHSMRSCSRARSLSPLSPPGKKGRRSSATPEELSRPKSRPFPQEGKRFSRGTPFLDSSKRTPSLCRTKRLCRISEYLRSARPSRKRISRFFTAGNYTFLTKPPSTPWNVTPLRNEMSFWATLAFTTFMRRECVLNSVHNSRRVIFGSRAPR